VPAAITEDRDVHSNPRITLIDPHLSHADRTGPVGPQEWRCLVPHPTNAKDIDGKTARDLSCRNESLQGTDALKALETASKQ
jgi:hypothetical protein